ncbi:MAG: hypothetical protein K2L72_05210 [Clostridia bacterium]|nr:hypothetical protein [Clostridia bacterium]
MTKLKICAKMHLFIIISSLIIAIGMAVGTVCHFCANGFFNFGNEFSSYNSVTVTYYSSEFKDLDAIKPVCEEALNGLNAYEVSYADTTLGGEIVYKYSPKTDIEKLEAAVEKLNAELINNDRSLSSASVHEGTVEVGGSRAITFASIALASSAAFMFLYFILRYKLRAAFSALLASVHNLGVFVALAAITRIPVGAEMIALGAAVVVLTMILACMVFDRTRKNFAMEKYAKTERVEVVEVSSAEVRQISVYALCALAVAVVVLGVFAAIAQLCVGALAPCALALLGLLACFYGAVFFTPSVHGAIDGVCETVKVKMKSSKKDKKAKPAQPDGKEKA